MLRRPKVHRPHNHGPRVAEALLVGILFGVAIMLSTPITEFNWGVAFFKTWWFWMALPLGLLLLLGVFHRDCRHHKWRFIIGGLAVAGMYNTTVFFYPLDLNPITVADLVIGLGVSFAIVGTIGGLLNIGLAVLLDRLGERPKIQDGTLCPTCAYTIVGLSEPRCPECGHRFTPHDLEASPPSGIRQWRRVGLASFVALFFLIGVYLTSPYLLIRGLAGGRVNVGGAGRLLCINPKLSERILCDYLETGDQHERCVGATQLSFLFTQGAARGAPDNRTVEVLVYAATEDPAESVRRFAIGTLGLLSKDALFNVLPLALRDDSAEVRWKALAYAARGGGHRRARGTPFLIQALDDADQTVRTRAYNRLKANTGQTFPYDPTAPIEQRRAQQETWQQWWDSQQ